MINKSYMPTHGGGRCDGCLGYCCASKIKHIINKYILNLFKF